MVEYQEVCKRLFNVDEDIVRYTTYLISEIYQDDPAITCDVLQKQR